MECGHGSVSPGLYAVTITAPRRRVCVTLVLCEAPSSLVTSVHIPQANSNIRPKTKQDNTHPVYTEWHASHKGARLQIAWVHESKYIIISAQANDRTTVYQKNSAVLHVSGNGATVIVRHTAQRSWQRPQAAPSCAIRTLCMRGWLCRCYGRCMGGHRRLCTTQLSV